MTNIRRALEAAAAVGGDATYVEDVYSTYVYVGNGSTGQTITNGIDLDGEGGMVWFKCRSIGFGSLLFDTVRGTEVGLCSDTSAAEASYSSALTSFNSDGFTLQGNVAQTNESAADLVGWTFRKAPGFFDVVTYTGTGSARTVSHALDSVPGCIIIKADFNAHWFVYHVSSHASAPEDYSARLNQVNMFSLDAAKMGTLPTSSVFSVGDSNNISGRPYVAYLFANDDQSFGADSDESIIKCGSYTGNASADGPTISLGWEPQYVFIKNASADGNWYVMDIMRGIVTGGDSARLSPNLSDAEGSGGVLEVNADGFKIINDYANWNGSGNTLVYIAIRRPMKVPEAGTEVFGVDTRGRLNTDVPGFDTTFPIVDLAIVNALSGGSFYTSTRLTGTSRVFTNTNDVEGTSSNAKFDYMNGWYSFAGTDADQISWMFKRAPEFMDVVAYIGNGVAGTTQAHNLGVVPEMMMVKRRTGTAKNWAVYYGDNTDYLVLNNDSATSDDDARWNDTSPTSTVFTVGAGSAVNLASTTYIAYLFATLAGISKVGSYTADATLTTIDCGFAAGARYILIKRTDAAGDWYFWDYFRGIVAGNDPYMLLNDSAAEVTGTDYIDPENSGFQITAAGSSTINVDTAEYIFLAIA